MPDYVIKDPQSNRTITVRGDSPPSEAELTELFSKAPAAKEPAADTSFKLGDVARGVVKGAGNTVFGLGKLVHDYTPVGRISDAIQPGAFDQKPPEIVPNNTAEKVGFAGEQIGEFFLPTGAAGKVGKLAEVGKSGLLTLAQGGSPTEAGVSAALTAAIPGGKVASTAAQALESSAQKSMAQALGATKEWAKAEAQKLAPQMLQRGIGGSREAMLDLAKTTAKRVGGDLDAAYAAATAAGETVPGSVIRGNLQVAKDALFAKSATGASVVIPGTERVVRQLDKLDTFVNTLPADIPVDQAAKVKRVWDRIVSKAGLFGPKAAASATDSADAWAIREASGSFRDLLNTNPTIDALNKESAFWTGLKDVLKETEKRTQAQSGGLVRAGMGGTGAVVGAMSGDSYGDKATKAVLGGIAGRQLVALIQSPAFRTQVSAPLKQVLADALASGNTARIASTVGRIVSALPAQMAPLTPVASH